MEFDINTLTLIDLISEKHAQLRRKVEKRWREQSEIHFSHAEWHLLAKVEQKSITISQAASIVGISRQAMQKSVKKLEEQGYIRSYFQEGNKRDKYLNLTETGEAYCRKNNQIKIEMEQELEKQLGKQELDSLKSLFKQKWLKD